jgi:hypothetical protein
MPRSTKHTIAVTLPQGPRDLGAEVDLEITFSHSYGVPPTRVCPGHGDIIEFVSVKCGLPYGDAFDDLRQASMDDLASDWLAEDGYADAVEKARADHEAEEQRADDMGFNTSRRTA